MAIFGAFIGIDRYLHPRIRDLAGARRDALALWALFSDTLPDIDGQLLVDEQASAEAIRANLNRTLGMAGPDDTVILSFSGHGSHDHRIIPHDADPDDLIDTSIPMGELAARFKGTRANVVLCILDCCFSGGAPARVLEESPIARDLTDPLQALAGEGRILIAAANVDEVAYEIPSTRHGILTKALIDVLANDEGVISLPSAIDRVQAAVRAEAARIGRVQTPVFLGNIVGGLSIPALRRGKRFYAAFPELRGARTTGNVADLAAWGLPEPVLSEWSARFTSGLNALQTRAINDHRILDGNSLLVVAPTSSGKTFIGEMAAVRAVLDGRKAVFLLPYRALVNEKYDDFQALYGERLGMRVARCTGDFTDQVEVLMRGKYDLALLTYEMFLNLAVSSPTLLDQIGLVVLDEAQFLADPGRGMSVELLLTFVLSARERGITPQLIALSAVIGNINGFDRWLGCDKLMTLERPVPLTEGVMDRSGTYQFLHASGRVGTAQLLPPSAIRVRRKDPSAQDMIVPLVRQLVEQGEHVLVFRNQRGAAAGCAKYLAAELGLLPAQEAVDALPQYDLSRASPDLQQCLLGGTAFHNANLSRDERVVVERAFRSPDGGVRVMAATTTVAAGINTPASTVILAEQQFVGEDGRPFTVAEYKNMAGRAGRLGFSHEGKAIILADSAYQREELFQRYVQGELEPLRSAFDPDQLETWVVKLLAQVVRVPRNEVARLLANTFGGYVMAQHDPGWQARLTIRLEALIEHMMNLDLVEQVGDEIQLTLLGRACGRSTLTLSSALRLVELLQRVEIGGLTAERLMVVLQALPANDSAYTPVNKRSNAERARPRQAAERYGSELVQMLRSGVADEFEWFARCKRTLILSDWINGMALETIERAYSTNFGGDIFLGDVRRIADITRLHLRSAHQLASVMFLDRGPDEAEVDVLMKQLELGVPREALELLELPVTLSRGEYLALWQAGKTTSAGVWACSLEELQSVLGDTRADQLWRLRPSQ